MNKIPIRFISALLLAVSVDAASLTVNSIADDGTGTCTPSKCTLRDAVLSAATGDTITFSAFTPTAKSVVTLRLISRSAAANGYAIFDTIRAV